MDSEPSPPAADLEHVIVGDEVEVVADPIELRALGVRQRLARRVEHRARIAHRLVEHRLEELVAEVVVVGNVPPGPEQPVSTVEPRPRGDDAPYRTMAMLRGLGVAEQELEEPHEVAAVPLARRVGLAEADLTARRETAKQTNVVDRHLHHRPVAEPAQRSVRQRHLERPTGEMRERALEHRDRDPVDERSARRGRRPHRRDRCAHPLTEPWPGTNAGLWWKGTRFSHRRRAWRWMSAVTCSG